MEEERAKLETELARWKRSLGLEIVSTTYDASILSSSKVLNYSLYIFVRSGITFIFTNLVREDPEKKFRWKFISEMRLTKIVFEDVSWDWRGVAI